MEKSRLFGSLAHVSPVVGYAGRTGLNPNVIRSNGVKKCRRLFAGSDDGPSGGNFASDAAFTALATLVMPSSRVVNWYAPATLSGPETLDTLAIAVSFAAWSTLYDSTSGLLKYFAFVQLYVPLRPICSGKYCASAGGVAGVWFVDCSSTVVTGAPLPPACWNTTFTGPTPYAHHVVRTPLPYGSPSAPACVICDWIFAARTGCGNAGTVTISVPW